MNALIETWNETHISVKMLSLKPVFLIIYIITNVQEGCLFSQHFSLHLI